MTASRRPVAAVEDKAEDYDEQAGSGLANRYRLRRRGWRKNPAGGYVCPIGSCQTTADIHHRAHHESWHTQLEEDLDGFDRAWDEHAAEHELLANELAELRARLSDAEGAWKACVAILNAERSTT